MYIYIYVSNYMYIRACSLVTSFTLVGFQTYRFMSALPPQNPTGLHSFVQVIKLRKFYMKLLIRYVLQCI